MSYGLETVTLTKRQEEELEVRSDVDGRDQRDRTGRMVQRLTWACGEEGCGVYL